LLFFLLCAHRSPEHLLYQGICSRRRTEPLEHRHHQSAARRRRSSQSLPHRPCSIHPEHHDEVRKPPLFLFRASWCLAPSPLYAVVRRPPHRTRCRHGHRDHLLESPVGFIVFPASCRTKPCSKPSPITHFCVRRRNSGHLPARSHRAPPSTAARPLASHQDRLIQDRRTRSLTPSL
jgi:hypothetical protein